MPFQEPPQIERQQAARTAAEEAILERVRSAARQSQNSAELEKLRSETRDQFGPRGGVDNGDDKELDNDLNWLYGALSAYNP
jgi:hypothetical protein